MKIKFTELKWSFDHDPDVYGEDMPDEFELTTDDERLENLYHHEDPGFRLEAKALLEEVMEFQVDSFKISHVEV